jgi:hypothetical protein
MGAGTKDNKLAVLARYAWQVTVRFLPAPYILCGL